MEVSNDLKATIVHQSYTTWNTNRKKASAGQLGWTGVGEGLGIPELNTYVCFYRFMTAHLPGRRSIFLLLRELASAPVGPYIDVFKTIINNMYYTEMTHIGMIEEHLLRNNPDILALPEFGNGEKSILADAITIMAGYPAEDQPFLRILADKKEIEGLNVRHYTLMYAAARAIASMYKRNITNIQAGDSQPIIEFQNKVKEAMLRKFRMGKLIHSEAMLATMGKKAGAASWEATLNDMEVPNMIQEQDGFPDLLAA